MKIVWAGRAAFVLILAVVLVTFDWGGDDHAAYVPPLCIKSHWSIEPAHLVIYAYDLHTAFVSAQVSAYWVPAAPVLSCDQWIGGF